MARTHAKVYAAIWSDPDFVTLSSDAQRTYMLLLSQAKLNLVGVLTYLPTRWARLAPDTTAADVERSVAELEAARYVIVDRDTEELLVRTLVRHDIATVTRNSRLTSGMWNAWLSTESHDLRVAALAEMPDALWTNEKALPPPEALEMRSSQQSEPEERTASSGCESELPASCLLPPASCRQPESEPVVSAQPLRPEAERRQRAEAAIEELTDRAMATATTRGSSIDRHRNGVRNGKTTDHLTDLLALAHHHPDWTATHLADAVEPPTPHHRDGPAQPAPWTPRVITGAVPMTEGARNLAAIRTGLAGTNA